MVALAGMAGLVFWRLLLWIRNSPVHTDPWDATTEEAVQQPDAAEMCPHCSTPVAPGNWFCEFCGRAVGPYNNWMPYLNAFSEGEVFRNGVTDHVRRNALIIAGYLLISFNYLIFAPIYWVLLFRNLFRTSPEAAPPRAEGPTS
jgi:hypothetical protein